MAKSPAPTKTSTKVSNRKAFRKGIFPEENITPDMIKTFSFVIECAPGQPSTKDFKMTEGMLLTKVPLFMVPPIEFCDHLLKVNDKVIAKPRDLRNILKAAAKSTTTHFLVIQIRRIMSVEQINEDDKLPSNASILRPPTNNPLIKPSTGYAYYRTVLIYFPRSKLGINVKSYNDVVYVESTDNTWGSTTRRFLYVGDAILKIDNEEVYDLKKTELLLKNALQTNGVATLIIERATGQMAANYVRSVLSFNKCNDPQLASDVIEICKKQHLHFTKNGFGPEPKSIFKENKERRESSNHVSITKKVEYMMIGCEQYNPATMMKVPNYMNPATNQMSEGEN